MTDFSIASNPNGVWSYLAAGAPFPLSDGSSIVFDTGGSGLQWYNGHPVPTAVTIVQNVSGSVQQHITIRYATNYLSLDPEALSVSVVFTAPSTGFYQIAGQFFGDDVTGNAHPVSVIEDGTTTLLSGTIANFGDTVALDISRILNAGDTIAFNVGTGSTGCSFCFLSTALWAEVTTNSNPIAIPAPDFPAPPPPPEVPEPAMLPMLCLGLAGLLLWCARNRRRRQSGCAAV